MILTTAECLIVEKALKRYVPVLDGYLMRALVEGSDAKQLRAERETALDLLDRLTEEMW